jgi:hypothetical protein
VKTGAGDYYSAQVKREFHEKRCSDGEADVWMRLCVTMKLAVKLFLSYIVQRCTYYNDDDADVDYYVDVCTFFKGLLFFSMNYK